MNRTAIPSVYPAEGTFEFSPIHINLSCATSGARIHYTLDGSEPTEESPVYLRQTGLLPLQSGLKSGQPCVVRAFAEADGLERSRIISFTYRFCCRQKGAYRHEMLREPAANTTGIIRIEDYALDKMYLVIGTKRAVLIDAGWDAQGDLPALCAELTGGALPVDLIVAHGHPDHIAQAAHFLEAGKTVYMPHLDADVAASFGWVISREKVRDIRDGTLIDLGNAVLRAYQIAGHTPGGVVLADEASGDVFSSDELGNNRRYVPDTAWLQLSECSIESCLNALNAFISATQGKLQRIFSGHNDEILDADAYLNVLKRAYQKAVDRGDDALVPSLRSAAESFGSGTATIEGDYRYDPVWGGANLRFIYEADRTAVPPRYARGYTPGMQTNLD